MSLATSDTIEAVRNSKKRDSPRGISCYFVKLVGNWGVKIYSDINERNAAARRQLNAAVFGLAPQVGESFTCDDGKYCYITEVAEILVDPNDDSDTRWNNDGKLNVEIEEVNRKLRLIGLHTATEDAHYGNYGRINGKLVRIDFGD